MTYIHVRETRRDIPIMFFHGSKGVQATEVRVYHVYIMNAETLYSNIDQS